MSHTPLAHAAVPTAAVQMPSNGGLVCEGMFGTASPLARSPTHWATGSAPVSQNWVPATQLESCTQALAQVPLI